MNMLPLQLYILPIHSLQLASNLYSYYTFWYICYHYNFLYLPIQRLPLGAPTCTHITQKSIAIYCLVLFSIGDYKLWSLIIIREPLKISFSFWNTYSMCEYEFVIELIWPWDELDLIIWPWDFSAVYNGCTS